MVLGLLLGLLIPFAKAIGLLRTLFVRALKAIASLDSVYLGCSCLIRFTIGAKTNMRTIVALYFTGTFAATLATVLASYLFPIKLLLSSSAMSAELVPPQGIT